MHVALTGLDKIGAKSILCFEILILVSDSLLGGRGDAPGGSRLL